NSPPFISQRSGSERGGLRLVPSLIDGGNEVIDRCLRLVMVDLHTPRREMHGHVLDAIKPSDLLLDLAHARRARESFRTEQRVGRVSNVGHDRLSLVVPVTGIDRSVSDLYCHPTDNTKLQP